MAAHQADVGGPMVHRSKGPRVLAAVLIVAAMWLSMAPRARTASSQRGNPSRIVTLVPAVTEMLFAIGAGGDVAGVSSYDRFPSETLAKPKVGALVDPDFERILSLRPDLVIVLLDPMARRVAWLREVVAELGLVVSVYRGRAEDPQVRDELGGKDVVTARAVAPLGRLAGWCLPLVAPGGRLLAVKGATAEEEAARDALAVRAAGGGPVEIVRCGGTIVRPPTTVVVVPRRIQCVTRTAGARRRKVR